MIQQIIAGDRVVSKTRQPDRRGDRAGQMVVTDFNLPNLAANFSGMLGRMVVDNTGLSG